MRYGLIGEHLTHSYSCEIHAAIADYDYELRELRPEELEDFLRRRDFQGINVTIPYKEQVIPFLDHVSDTARRIGAVNTVVNRDGALYGYNTDFAGMTALMRRMELEVSGKKVLILGTGGTSKTARAAAQALGAGEIVNVSRSGRGGAVTYQEAYERHADASFLINATPAGMYPDTRSRPAELSAFPALEGVVDAVYHPLRTNLVLDAQARGIAASGGLYMLSAQAVYASALFLERDAEEALIEKAYRGVLWDKENLALLGMPSAGKTTVGQRLAALTGKCFVDTDQEITAQIGMPIAAYFAAHGEAAFREVERRVIQEVSLRSGCIIATGGGAVLDAENVRALRQNSAPIFLDRAPEKLIFTADRPLSATPEALEQRYRERYDLYCAAAALRVDGNGTVEETANLILEAMKP